MKFREAIEWCNVWAVGCDQEAGAPRLLLIGDSITQSYYDGVARLLDGRYRCARITTSRCAGDPQLKKEMALLLDEFPFAAIHFNNGLHGWDYSESDYAAGLADAFAFLRERAPQSRLIWASTTPVWEKQDSGVLAAAKTDRVRERNRLAASLAASRGILINDLFSRVIDHPEWVSADGVHFAPAGQEALAEQVAALLCDLPR